MEPPSIQGVAQESPEDRAERLFLENIGYRYVAIDTPSNLNLCGLFAIRRSFRAQFPSVPVPSLLELYHIATDEQGEMWSGQLPGIEAREIRDPSNYFSFDHLGGVLELWGRTQQFNYNLGVVFSNGGNPEICFLDNDDPRDTRILWIHHTGCLDETGELHAGHFSGVRAWKGDRTDCTMGDLFFSEIDDLKSVKSLMLAVMSRTVQQRQHRPYVEDAPEDENSIPLINIMSPTTVGDPDGSVHGLPTLTNTFQNNTIAYPVYELRYNNPLPASQSRGRLRASVSENQSPALDSGSRFWSSSRTRRRSQSPESPCVGPSTTYRSRFPLFQPKDQNSFRQPDSKRTTQATWTPTSDVRAVPQQTPAFTKKSHIGYFPESAYSIAEFFTLRKQREKGTPTLPAPQKLAMFRVWKQRPTNIPPYRSHQRLPVSRRLNESILLDGYRKSAAEAVRRAKFTRGRAPIARHVFQRPARGERSESRSISPEQVSQERPEHSHSSLDQISRGQPETKHIFPDQPPIRRLEMNHISPEEDFRARAGRSHISPDQNLFVGPEKSYISYDQVAGKSSEGSRMCTIAGNEEVCQICLYCGPSLQARGGDSGNDALGMQQPSSQQQTFSVEEGNSMYETPKPKSSPSTNSISPDSDPSLIIISSSEPSPDRTGKAKASLEKSPDVSDIIDTENSVDPARTPIPGPFDPPRPHINQLATILANFSLQYQLAFTEVSNKRKSVQNQQIMSLFEENKPSNSEQAPTPPSIPSSVSGISPDQVPLPLSKPDSAYDIPFDLETSSIDSSNPSPPSYPFLIDFSDEPFDILPPSSRSPTPTPSLPGDSPVRTFKVPSASTSRSQSSHRSCPPTLRPTQSRTSSYHHPIIHELTAQRAAINRGWTRNSRSPSPTTSQPPKQETPMYTQDILTDVFTINRREIIRRGKAFIFPYLPSKLPSAHTCFTIFIFILLIISSFNAAPDPELQQQERSKNQCLRCLRSSTSHSSSAGASTITSISAPESIEPPIPDFWTGMYTLLSYLLSDEQPDVWDARSNPMATGLWDEIRRFLAGVEANTVWFIGAFLVLLWILRRRVW